MMETHPAAQRIRAVAAAVDVLLDKHARLRRRAAIALAHAAAVRWWHLALLRARGNSDRADQQAKKVVMEARGVLLDAKTVAEELLRRQLELDSVTFDDVEDAADRAAIRAARKEQVTRINNTFTLADRTIAFTDRVRATAEAWLAFPASSPAASTASPAPSAPAEAVNTTCTVAGDEAVSADTDVDMSSGSESASDESEAESPRVASPTRAPAAIVPPVLRAAAPAQPPVQKRPPLRVQRPPAGFPFDTFWAPSAAGPATSPIVPTAAPTGNRRLRKPAPAQPPRRRAAPHVHPSAFPTWGSLFRPGW